MYNLLVKIGCFFNYCRFCFVMIGMKIYLLLKQICGMNLEWRYFRIKFLYVFKILFVNCYMFIEYEFVILFFFFQCFDNFFQWKELEGVVMFGISSNFISQVWKDIYYQVSVRLGQVKVVLYLIYRVLYILKVYEFGGLVCLYIYRSIICRILLGVR